MKQLFIIILLVFSAIQTDAQVETNYYSKSEASHGIFKYM